MRIVLCLAVFLVLCLAQAGTGLCADTLSNIRRPQAPAVQGGPSLLVPGTVVRLPDGRQTRILEVLPGGIRTELGVTLTPEGKIEGAPEAAAVTVVEEAVAPAAPEVTPETPAAPENAALAPEVALPGTGKAPETAAPETAAPEATAPEEPRVAIPETPKAAETPLPGASTAPQAVTPATPESAPHQLTIVELLPMTPAGEPKAEKKPAPEEPKAAEKPKAEEKKAPAKEEKPRAEKPKTEKPKAEKPKETKKKPAVGEELRIPPEAAATGNLDFLEGCWQGTRPEYFSKRMIKECFCFDVHGGAGKRRVIDSIGGRMCIGSSKARLSKEGVLSVTSSGAACTDGERWGQAEMVCKGTGQRAPCTWVFKDAQGGRQSYEIPFVRVESCGR